MLPTCSVSPINSYIDWLEQESCLQFGLGSYIVFLVQTLTTIWSGVNELLLVACAVYAEHFIAHRIR